MLFPTLLVLAFAFVVYKEYDLFAEYLAKITGRAEETVVIDNSAFGKYEETTTTFEEDVTAFTELGEAFAMGSSWNWESSYVFAWVKGDNELYINKPQVLSGKKITSYNCPADSTIFISKYNKKVLDKQDYAVEPKDFIYAKCSTPECSSIGGRCFIVKMSLPESEY